MSAAWSSGTRPKRWRGRCWRRPTARTAVPASKGPLHPCGRLHQRNRDSRNSARIASIAAGALWRSAGRPVAMRARRSGLSRSRKHFARSGRAAALRPERHKPGLAFRFVLIAAVPAQWTVRYHYWTFGQPTSKRRPPSWQCRSQIRPPGREQDGYMRHLGLDARWRSHSNDRLTGAKTSSVAGEVPLRNPAMRSAGHDRWAIWARDQNLRDALFQ